MDPSVQKLFVEKRAEVGRELAALMVEGSRVEELAGVFIIDRDTGEFEVGAFQRTEAHARFVAMTPSAPAAIRAEIAKLAGPAPNGHAWFLVFFGPDIVVRPVLVYADGALGDA